MQPDAEKVLIHLSIQDSYIIFTPFSFNCISKLYVEAEMKYTEILSLRHQEESGTYGHTERTTSCCNVYLITDQCCMSCVGERALNCMGEKGA